MWSFSAIERTLHGVCVGQVVHLVFVEDAAASDG
jgi:hypothetical protein